MKYFYDWEFEENGQTIIPISLGMVSEDNRYLYIINEDYLRAWENGQQQPSRWLVDNVLNQIPATDRAVCGCSLVDFPNYILNFVGDNGKYKDRTKIELWGYFGAYDHVCLAQRFGPMINLPQPIPMFTNEIMQLPNKNNVVVRRSAEHNALNDAIYQKELYEAWK